MFAKLQTEIEIIEPSDFNLEEEIESGLAKTPKIVPTSLFN